jgi:hypothetical protein
MQSEKLEGIDTGFYTCKKGAKKGASEISRLKGKGEVCIIP